VPQDWADLLKPEYKGQVALSGDPRISTQAYLSVMAASLANGGSADDMMPGLEFFKKLNEAGNFVPQKRVALLGSVTPEGAVRAHFVHGRMKRADTGRRQCAGDIPDTQLDDLLFGMRRLVGRHPLGDFRKKIGGLQLQEILVDPDHETPLAKTFAAAPGRPARFLAGDYR